MVAVKGSGVMAMTYSMRRDARRRRGRRRRSGTKRTCRGRPTVVQPSAQSTRRRAPDAARLSAIN
jgi:hypothetical protein